MKRILFQILFLFVATVSFAQTIQGRLKPGSTANSVIIALKSSSALSGQITNVQFVIQIPATANPAPIATIRSNFASAAVPTANYLMPAAVEATGFRNYLFAATTLGTPVFNFPNNTEVDFLEISFSGGPLTPQEIRLAQLPDGLLSAGPIAGQFNFYIEVAGVDRTNQTAMFYGTGATNSSSGYSGYSFNPLANIILPVSWLNFNATRQASDVLLSWEVANEEQTDRYELEVSTNGVNFSNFGSKTKSAGNGLKKYSHTDLQVARYNSRILHYRIKQFDQNGEFSYSPVKSVRLDVKGETALYPNPAKEGFTVTISYLQPDQKRIQLHLVNNLGQVVERRDITRMAATNYYFSLKSSAVASGEYLLKVFEDGELTETKRLMINR